jgi:putative glutathione S-transferase
MSKARTALDEQSNDGEFKRRDAAWRNWISQKEGATHPPEGNNRYHLYVAHACPWAHRTLMTRALKGLEDAISITVVHPTWQKTKPYDAKDAHTGWVFGQPGGAALVNTAGKGGPIPAAFPGNREFFLVFCVFPSVLNFTVFLLVDFFCLPDFLRT